MKTKKRPNKEPKFKVKYKYVKNDFQMERGFDILAKNFLANFKEIKKLTENKKET